MMDLICSAGKAATLPDTCEVRLFRAFFPELARGIIEARLKHGAEINTDEFSFPHVSLDVNYFSDEGYMGSGMGIDHELKSEICRQLGEMGFAPDDQRSWQMQDHEVFEQYWKIHAQNGLPPEQVIPRRLLSFGVPPECDLLTEEVLLQAIPDHVGHGVYCHTLEDVRREAAIEGADDRSSARQLWNVMTEFWEAPNAHSLLKLFNEVSPASEWVFLLMKVELQQRGRAIPTLLNWRHVLYMTDQLKSEMVRRLFSNYVASVSPKHDA